MKLQWQVINIQKWLDEAGVPQGGAFNTEVSRKKSRVLYLCHCEMS